MKATPACDIVHKAMYKSSIKDPSKINTRTSLCEKVVVNSSVNSAWEKVNCAECLGRK